MICSILIVMLPLSAVRQDRPVYSKPRVNIAHRGASAYAPEHTLAAYRLAIDMKADFVEPDLQLTRDGVLICLHDSTLERTTNVAQVFPERFRILKEKKHWVVADFTLAEIKQLDAGAWFDNKFKGEKVPTLEEMLEVVRGKAGVFPETKSPESHEASGFSMEKQLMDVLKKNGLDRPGTDPMTPVVIQSFSLASLRKMRKEHGCELPLVLLFPKKAGDALTALNLKKLKADVDGVGPHKANVLDDPEVVERCHQAGLSVTLFTCGTTKPAEFNEVKAEMKRFLDLKVDAIFTDNPDLFPR